jgi:hypothetical protein
MAVSNAEQSLIVALLKQSFGPQVALLAGYLAAYKPDGKFSITKNPEKGVLAGPEGNELTFKYIHTLRNKKQLNITFALHAEPIGKKGVKFLPEEYELQFVIKRSGFVGEQQFTQASTNGVRISTGKLRWFARYAVADLHDAEAYWELDFQHYLNNFESDLVKEVSTCTSKFKRKKSTADIKVTKQVNSENKLKQELFTQHGLVGNERREKLFAYLLKHCNYQLRLVETMFNEMVHIIE